MILISEFANACRPAWSIEEGTRRVGDLFFESFGENPLGVWSAPGRVNLIGEHTDYNGGMTLPIALPHRTFVAVKPRADRQVRLVSAQETEIRTVDLDHVGPAGSPWAVAGWPAYIVGVAWVISQEGYGEVPGFDIAVDSCVPYGAGLSSSAALESAVALALVDLLAYTTKRALPDLSDEFRSRIAAWCVRAENEIVGAPTGGMDQVASLRAKEGYAIGIDCSDNSVTPVPFDLSHIDASLLVIDTKTVHALVDGQYGSRRRACEEAAAILGVDYLAGINDLPRALSALSDPVAKRLVRHVVSEIGRTREVIDLLQRQGISSQTISEIAEKFLASHQSLRDDYEVSCPELDVAVQAAVEGGAWGARMTGGGFGGSVIALVPTRLIGRVTKTVEEAFAAWGFNPPAMLLASPSAPAERSKKNKGSEHNAQ